MKKSILNKILIRILGIILFILIWQILSMVVGDSSFILPGPFKTFNEAVKMISDDYLYKCIGQTMSRMIIGFIISFVLAFIFGIIAGNNKTFKELIKPTITILRSLPTATIVYLFLVLVGARLTPMYIVILVSFPILYESITAGIESTPSAIVDAAKLDTSSIVKMNVHIRIPLAVNYIVVGVASSFALSLKIEIMAEVITGYTRQGLGSAILAAQRSDPTNMVPVFAYSFFAILIMLVFDTISDVIKSKYDD